MDGPWSNYKINFSILYPCEVFCMAGVKTINPPPSRSHNLHCHLWPHCRRFRTVQVLKVCLTSIGRILVPSTAGTAWSYTQRTCMAGFLPHHSRWTSWCSHASHCSYTSQDHLHIKGSIDKSLKTINAMVDYSDDWLVGQVSLAYNSLTHLSCLGCLACHHGQSLGCVQ